MEVMQESVVFVDRRNTDCNKWDNLGAMFGEENLQAMWVADMDFKCPQCVTEAIGRYTEMGAFGYYKVPESYYRAFMDWEQTYHRNTVERDWIRFSPGVVPAINWLIRILSREGDGVLVQTPVYYPFMDAVKNNGRRLICSDLVNTKGLYTVDFAAFERAIVDNGVKIFVLCSPHNPVGRVWKETELRQMLDICKAHGVYVISDEIHHDIVFAPHRHIPTATVGDYDERLITLTAASKTFNLAGLQNSFALIPNPEIRRKYDEFMEQIRIRSGNPFGYVAVEAAYTKGRPWLEQVREIIYDNYLYAKETLESSLPGVRVTPLEGTYLLWIDFGEYLRAEEMKDFMQKKCALALDYGEWFGGERFATFVRMNLATSRELVKYAVKSIIMQINIKDNK